MWIFFQINYIILMLIYAFILNTYFESTLQNHNTLINVNAEDGLHPPLQKKKKVSINYLF